MGESSISKVISFSIFFIAIKSIQQWTSFPIGNYAIWLLIQTFILIAFMWEIRFKCFNPLGKRHIRFVSWLLLYNVFSLIRGVFIAETYWDTKLLVTNIFVLLLPIIAYISVNNFRLQAILSVFVKFALPMSVFFFPFLNIGSWGWYLVPIAFLLLFFPVLTTRWKIIVLLIALISMFGDLSSRSHIIRFGVPVLLLIFYYFRFFIGLPKIMEFSRMVLFLTPFLFFFLAVSGVFNVFKIEEYIKGSDEFNTTSVDENGNVINESMAEDTRTFLYEEVLFSAQKNNYWWIGRSPARGNDTEAFSGVSEIYGREERPSNEVGILNIFTWTGLLGVMLTFLVFYRSSYLAINRSNNIFSKLIGLFVAFHWFYCWVENQNRFDINNFVIWMMIGLCFSTSFRQMNNAEVKLWIRGVFEKKYSFVYRKYVLGIKV